MFTGDYAEMEPDNDFGEWVEWKDIDPIKDAFGWAIPALERYVDALGLNVDEGALDALYKCKDAYGKMKDNSNG